jgi:integrase
LGEIPANYRPTFICLALTGLRAGELLGLQWKNVNLETGELRV